MNADNAVPFIAGFTVTVGNILYNWFHIPSMGVFTFQEFIALYGSKLASTLVFGLFGGAMGMLGKDIYRMVKGFIKNKFVKWKQRKSEK